MRGYNPRGSMLDCGMICRAQGKHRGKHRAHKAHPANADQCNLVRHVIDPPEKFIGAWCVQSKLKRHKQQEGSLGIR